MRKLKWLLIVSSLSILFVNTLNISFAEQLQAQTAEERLASPASSPKGIVDRFNQMAFFDQDPVAAVEKYISPHFIERGFALSQKTIGDKEGLKRVFLERGWGDNKIEDVIYQVITEDDTVVVFHHVTKEPNDPGVAFVDIFRVEDGLIVEHWDVGQPVPKRALNKDKFSF